MKKKIFQIVSKIMLNNPFYDRYDLKIKLDKLEYLKRD